MDLKKLGDSIARQAGGLVVFAAIYFVIPIELARSAIGANWQQIGISYAVLYGVIGLVGLGGHTSGEKIGWIMILGMFFTIPGIPVLCLLLKGFGVAT